MASTLESRREGAFWGIPVGDALGAPVEFCERGTFEPVTGMRAGGYFRLPAGAWTDDTAMALCLAQSLTAYPELNPQDLMQRFARWAEHGENSSTGKCIGIGQNTFRVIGNFIRTGEYLAPEAHQRSDGNGALMRLSPVACMHYNNIPEAKRIATLQSRVTHNSDISATCCEIMAEMLCRLINGEGWNDVIQITTAPTWPQEVINLFSTDWQSKTIDEIKPTGYVIDTFEAALWSVGKSSNFKEALLTAVNLGGDADTIGAVAGQLAGARFGIEEISIKWVENLLEYKLLKETASRFFG